MDLKRILPPLVLSLFVAAQASAQSATKFAVPGSAVTASTYDVTNNAVPANAVDGSLTTRWAGQGDGANITFDLGSTRSVQFIKIAWYQGDTRTTTFDVLAGASSSGPWTTLINRGVSSGATTSLETLDFADTNARYIRIVGHGNSSGNGWNSISEVELWGAAASTGGGQLPIAGSAVTASTYDVTNNAIPSNAVDTDLTTRWAGQGDGAYITFDLGSTQGVQLIKIAWYQGNTRTTTFDVLAGASSSGPWTTLINRGVSSGTTADFETYDFADISARYVRIVGHGNSSGNGWNSISEVELWGASAGTVDQVATPTFTPAPGTYTSAQTVSITSATAGASIRYTTDGSTPTTTTGTVYSGPISLGTTTTLKAIAYQSGLTPSPVRTGTYTIGAGGLDPSAPPSGNFDLSHWKITLPDATEVSASTLSHGYELENTFYTDPVTGGMVFRCPNLADTTSNSSYSRTELREMLDPSGGSASAPANNWVMSTSSSSAKAAAGGVDGTLRATLSVDHVSTTGESAKVGRVIVGQIHGPDSEPIRLYFHKRPSDARGAIYFAHDTPSNSNSYHAIIGDPNNLNPSNGILLGETWSYEIKVVGQNMTVKVTPKGRATVTATFSLESGYNNLGMYFKAGVYNQNNTGTASDYVQATFYSLTHTHP
jgi:poly(beta-D-mannuronate) lyase